MILLHEKPPFLHRWYGHLSLARNANVGYLKIDIPSRCKYYGVEYHGCGMFAGEADAGVSTTERIITAS